MKRIMFIFTAAALVCAMTVGVSAHGHGRRVNASSQNSLCPVEDCYTTGIHRHDGADYRSHYAGDGHDYHQACTVEGCVRNGIHEHDGMSYYCHDAATGGAHCRRS